MAQRIKQVNGRYPTGWLESSGPIRTRRQRYGTRHVPNHTPFGGYDLCGEVQSEQPSTPASSRRPPGSRP